MNNVSVDDTAQDPGPGKGIRNPRDEKGRGCKHILLVLSNQDFLMKVASVINNYIHYMEENMKDAFLKVIFPKLYGVTADEMVEKDIIDDGSDDALRRLLQRKTRTCQHCRRSDAEHSQP